ncbi:MAG: hypothetical protein ABIA02_03840 [Candidatus Falkowbacteria bacterium]
MKNQSPLKRNKLKKISKLVSSRMLYLCLGLFFALSIFVANAAWNSTVSTSDPLTATLWNDVVAKLVDIDNQLTRNCNVITGNEGTVCCPAGQYADSGGYTTSGWNEGPGNFYPVNDNCWNASAAQPGWAITVYVKCCDL